MNKDDKKQNISISVHEDLINFIEKHCKESKLKKSRFIENQSMTDTIIYKDTIILVIWTAKPPIAIVIKNQDNANSYLNNFNILWKNSTKN